MAEKKYRSYELKVLPILESLDRFRIYLLAKKFNDITDCEAIVATSNKQNIIPSVCR